MKKNNLDQYNISSDQWWTDQSPFRALSYLNKPRFEFFDQTIQNWNGLKALDIGCGGGYASEFMAKRGIKVSGIDLSDKSVEAAKYHAKETGLEIDYRIGCAESLPFPDQQFEVVLCVDVLEHMANLPKVFQEAYRVLKPNGYLLFDTINRTLISKIVMIWIMEYLLEEIPKGTHDWKMFIRPEELIHDASDAGFTDIQLKGLGVRGRERKTGVLNLKLTNNTSIMYLGRARKSG